MVAAGKTGTHLGTARKDAVADASVGFGHQTQASDMRPGRGRCQQRELGGEGHGKPMRRT